MQAGEILEACVYAEDLGAAERFYTSVLEMEVMARVEGRHVFFRCGGRVFLVFNPARTRDGAGAIPGHGADGAGHVCFAMRADQVEAWRAHLQASGVPVESDYTWPGGGHSLYFSRPGRQQRRTGHPRHLENPRGRHVRRLMRGIGWSPSR